MTNTVPLNYLHERIGCPLRSLSVIDERSATVATGICDVDFDAYRVCCFGVTESMGDICRPGVLRHDTSALLSGIGDSKGLWLAVGCRLAATDQTEA